ncbi:hypothetical protein SUDANB15_00270 [Streptomyces sp. enrichment culture]
MGMSGLPAARALDDGHDPCGSDTAEVGDVTASNRGPAMCWTVAPPSPSLTVRRVFPALLTARFSSTTMASRCVVWGISAVECAGSAPSNAPPATARGVRDRLGPAGPYGPSAPRLPAGAPAAGSGSVLTDRSPSAGASDGLPAGRYAGSNQSPCQVGALREGGDRERPRGESALMRHEKPGGEGGGIRAPRSRGREFPEKVQQPELLVRDDAAHGKGHRALPRRAVSRETSGPVQTSLAERVIVVPVSRRLFPPSLHHVVGRGHRH